MDSELKIEESQLVEQTLAGVTGAYDELYTRYSGSVLSMLIFRCAGDEQLAKDIVQEAFIKAFVNIEKFDAKYTFGQWIHTIARNLFIDYTRRRRNERGEMDTNTPCELPNPEQRVINKQNGRELEIALGKLPVHYRTIFSLRYISDLSYDEIAERQSMPMGTVKTQIHRARERFLRELGIVSFEKV